MAHDLRKLLRADLQFVEYLGILGSGGFSTIVVRGAWGGEASSETFQGDRPVFLARVR